MACRTRGKGIGAKPRPAQLAFFVIALLMTTVKSAPTEIYLKARRSSTIVIFARLTRADWGHARALRAVK